MALVIVTPSPNRLLSAINKAIDEGHVDTWMYDRDGDFTHTPDQWRGKAWLRPYVQQGVLLFGLIGLQGIAMTQVVYGVYHGRFVEMLLTHFDTEFTGATATAQADSVDTFK